MTRNRVLLTLIAAAIVIGAAGPDGRAASAIKLKAISSKVGSTGASLVVEASEPVPYTATQPDPLTLLLDFRNATLDGVVNRVPVSPKSLIAAVEFENTDNLGAPVSRVRILLTQATTHRVRSERNTVVVDFDRTGQPSVYAADPRAPLNAMSAMNAVAPSKPSALEAVRAIGLPLSRTGQAAAAAVQQQPTTTTAPQSRRYTGALSTWDLEGADLRGTLRLIQNISGLNMVLDPSITGKVDIVLTAVPWDQALDVILRMNKLGAVVEDTIVRIAPLTVLAEEEAQRRKLSEEQALSGDLQIMPKTLSYAKANDLQPLLKTLLSSRGDIIVDARTNTLIIKDLPARLSNIEGLVVTLDRAEPQVEIEARIVRTTSTYAKALGIQWGFQGQASPYLGNTSGLAFPNNGSIAGRAPGAAAGTAVNMPAGGATSGVGLALGSINGAFGLDATLTALENAGQIKLLSTPRVSTLNNVEAEVAQGIQVPYQTTANNTVTTQWKDAALTLKVKPQITAANTVMMQIAVDKGSLGENTPSGPGINTQRATTTVLVSDGETTVIGGIYEGSETKTTNSVPGLSKIPFFKWLFQSEDERDRNDELLIFITPRISRK